MRESTHWRTQTVPRCAHDMVCLDNVGCNGDVRKCTPPHFVFNRAPSLCVTSSILEGLEVDNFVVTGSEIGLIAIPIDFRCTVA